MPKNTKAKEQDDLTGILYMNKLYFTVGEEKLEFPLPSRWGVYSNDKSAKYRRTYNTFIKALEAKGAEMAEIDVTLQIRSFETTGETTSDAAMDIEID